MVSDTVIVEGGPAKGAPPTPTTLLARLDRLPDAPGVYLMKGKRGEILYIGKANVLADRVRSYFQKGDRKSTRLNSSHSQISYAVFCLKKKTHVHNLRSIDLDPTHPVVIARTKQLTPTLHTPPDQLTSVLLRRPPCLHTLALPTRSTRR